VSVIITLTNIEEAMDNLNYRSESTLKSKLIRAVRNFYPDESSIGTLKSIDAEELVKYIWDTGENSDLIKNKRKNFSSIKSSVNSDLKKLYQEGKNPEGIIIGHNNIFDISDQAKNKALSGIADIFREKGIDTSSAITEIMSTMSDLLTGAISAANAEAAREVINSLQNLIGNLSGKLGLPAPEGDDQDKTKAREDRDVKTADQTRITNLAAEAGEGGGITEGILQSTGGRALTGITDILKDTEIDVRNKMNKIMEAVQDILSEAIALAGPELNSEEAGQIKNLFGDLSASFPSSEAQEKGAGKVNDLAAIGDIIKTQSTDAGVQVSNIVNEVREILADTFAEGSASLNSGEAQRIKNMFGTLAEKIKSALRSGRGLDNVEFGDKHGVGTDTGDIAKTVLEDSAAEIVEEIVEANAEEIIEVIAEIPEEELERTTVEEEAATAVDFKDIPQVEETETETIAKELAAAEVVEIIEEVVDDEFGESAADGKITPEAASTVITAADSAVKDTGLTGPGIVEEGQTRQPDGPAPDKLDYEEIVEIDDSTTLPQETLPEETIAGESASEETVVEDTVVEAAETLSEDYTIAETAIADNLEGLETAEIVEEVAGDEVEEIIEEQTTDKEDAFPVQDKTAGVAVEEDLHTRAEILEQLAAAAKALEKIGPDLSNSIYSEEEIKEKAKFLSEEFDRYLSVREKFYNQHILIKSGNYPVGGAGADKNVLPEQIVNLREFYIGKFPVTNALFEIFVEKTGYITTAEKYGFGLVYIPRMQKVKNAVTGRESFIWNNQLHYKKISGACWYRPAVRPALFT
jgi:hypothetical protein